MAGFKSDFMRIVHERGMVHQCSDSARLDELLSTGSRTAYIGFDCTADSLHVGHLLQVMLLRWWQKTGHKPIALMGGGTTKVGDPSGRDETRQLLTSEQIDANMACIKRSFANYLTFGSGPTDAVMANNAEWLDSLLYIPLLRDVGRHFSVNRMLTMDSVKLRLERDQPLTFLEFNYMILQSYDFVELYRRHKCIVQMGGSDQWGNIVMGADLGRRIEGADLFALTSPLLATSSGAKMGKTAAGAIWLNPDRLSPYEFWQYWRNAEDADVGRYLRMDFNGRPHRVYFEEGGAGIPLVCLHTAGADGRQYRALLNDPAITARSCSICRGTASPRHPYRRHERTDAARQVARLLFDLAWRHGPRFSQHADAGGTPKRLGLDQLPARHRDRRQLVHRVPAPRPPARRHAL